MGEPDEVFKISKRHPNTSAYYRLAAVLYGNKNATVRDACLKTIKYVEQGLGLGMLPARALAEELDYAEMPSDDPSLSDSDTGG